MSPQAAFKMAHPGPAKVLTVAVAGNPNSGKSTLINGLAGTRLQVGNWPGVTVEKKEAALEFQGRRVRLVDLPGTYSLSPYSQEEIITRNYLVQESPDVILNVVDATNLERNLYLTVQMLELGLPVVMALNIYDEARNKGWEINPALMEETLGIKVIPTVATRKEGLTALMEAVLEVGDNPEAHAPRPLNYGQDLEVAVGEVDKEIRRHSPALVKRYPARWLALKLLEADPLVVEETGLGTGSFISRATKHLKLAHGDDIESLLGDARYAQASGLTREVLKKKTTSKRELTEKIDRIVLHRFLGIPIFLAAMWVVFKLTFDVSNPYADWMNGLVSGPLKRWAQALLGLVGAPGWTVSLATDGVLAGVGFVIVFIPVIFAMMFFITFLEGSGYMARAAFVMDRAMHAMGLHGKSFIPLLLGFGCNVPAVYATRTLENPRDKILTALLIPLMSCGARLPVYVLFAGAFFPGRAGTAIWSLYVMGLVMAVLVGILFKKTLFRGENPLFIMELPPYRLPTLKSLLIHTWEKGKHFLIKAGTYILAVAVLVWFLLNLPWGVESKQNSYLGKTGAAIAPVFKPLGFGNWEAASSLITGVIAKEIVVGTMGEVYLPKEKKEESEKTPTFLEDLQEIGVSFLSATRQAGGNVVSSLGVAKFSAEEKQETKPLKKVIQGAFTPLSAYAFMTFVLLYMPCMVVAVAFRHEFGTWKWFGVTFVYQMTLAWLAAFVIYQGGRLLGLGG